MKDLTEREWQVLQLASEGKSNAAIGKKLYLTADTIKTHMRRAFRKLGVNDRSAAVVLGIQAGKIRDRRVGGGPMPPGGERRQVPQTLEEAYDRGGADERARFRWWLLEGINGPAAPNLPEEVRTNLLALVDLTYEGARWREAPPARPRF